MQAVQYKPPIGLVRKVQIIKPDYKNFGDDDKAKHNNNNKPTCTMYGPGKNMNSCKGIRAQTKPRK